MCTREQNMCKGTKNIPISQNEVHKGALSLHYGIELPCLPCMPCMALNGLEWHYLASYALFAFHDH